MLLHEVLKESAANLPENIAVESGKQSITYRELESLSSKLACLFMDLGCKRNDRIGVLLDKSIEAVVSFIAVLKAGCCYIPLDVSAPVDRLRYILDNADVRVIITDEKRCHLAEEINKKYHISKTVLIRYNSEMDTLMPQKNIYIFDKSKSSVLEEYCAQDISEEQPAYILYTSGSTGNPKGVVLSHKNAVSFVEWSHRYFDINSSDVLSSHAPFYFDLSVFDIYVSLKAGAKLCLLPKAASSFPVSLGKFIEEKKISTWYSVPSVLVNLYMYGKLESLQLLNLKRIIYAGEAFHVKFLKELMKKLPHVEFYNLYGPTETNVITYYHIKEKPDEITEDIPIGYACPYADIRVVSEEQNEAMPGERGELIVRGDSLMMGYMNKPELTEKVIREVDIPGLPQGKYYFTGDIVAVLDNGLYRFAGRKDHMVKVKGFRIELEEIEAVLLMLDGISECLVQCIEDNEKGASLRALVLCNRPLDAGDIIKFLKKSLPEYMIPYDIRFVKEFERNSRGKIDRKREYV